MSKRRTYKAFIARPSHVLDLSGELLNGAPVMAELASEVRDISAYATYVVRNDEVLGDELARVTAAAPADAGRRAGVTMPDFLETWRTGRSRKERLVQHNVVASHRSWQERVEAANGESSKYVSQGWKRTVNASAPSYGGDYVNLGAVDRAYARIENNPFLDGEIVLRMVIQGAWYRLIFDFDNERFTEGKVSLPLIKVQDGAPIFIFTVVTDNPVVQFSGDYTIGVDVGITDYATVVVRDVKTGRIVYETTLSQRVHSLWNSVRASERQVRALKAKAATLLHDRQARMSALDEAQFHREAASRKKRELAILAAQEIAYLSHVWCNTVVAVEDLGWVANTMQNGRWNRGALIKWLAHYVSQNGGWVIAVNPANTSQQCHVCGQRVTHPTRKLSVCPEHGVLDRDINAAANVAARAVSRVVKARMTRAKNRKLRSQAPLRTPIARNSLKNTGRSRMKSKPTPKRKNNRRVSKGVNLPLCPARAQASHLEASVLADQDTRVTLGTNMAALKQDTSMTYDRGLYNPVGYAKYMSVMLGDTSDGPGVRAAVYYSGCELRCEGCWSPQTWNPRIGRDMTAAKRREIVAYLERPEVAGLSLLGGDPFHPLNAADATALCALVRNHFGWDGERTIWAWTGYTFDELLEREHARMLLPMLDVVVDGPFILGERDLNLPFMGSRNQRVVDVQATLAGRRDGSLGVGEVVVLDEWMRAPAPPTVDA